MHRWFTPPTETERENPKAPRSPVSRRVPHRVPHRPPCNSQECIFVLQPNTKRCCCCCCCCNKACVANLPVAQKYILDEPISPTKVSLTIQRMNKKVMNTSFTRSHSARLTLACRSECKPERRPAGDNGDTWKHTQTPGDVGGPL